jgi:hypothetical protein
MLDVKDSIIPTEQFPEFRKAVLALGTTHEERRVQLGVTSTKTVERLLRRLPSPLAPLINSPAAARLLRALLSDIEQRA